MRFYTSIFSLVILLAGQSAISAQIALAVSKNENGSSTHYSLKTGSTFEEAYANARKDLEEQELENIFVLRSTEKTGHELKTGHYVLLISSRKIAGKFFVTFGLGISENSKQEAIDRAVIHMKEYDWGYDKKYGHAIEKEGKIEDLLAPKEEN